MKFAFFLVMTMLTMHAMAESRCDVRPGTSVGIRVIEFASGNVIHSKMPVKEATPSALREEMLNLQDMGICEEKIVSERCILKFEKHKKVNYVTMVRGNAHWKTWELKSKNEAQDFVKGLKRAGFCS